MRHAAETERERGAWVRERRSVDGGAQEGVAEVATYGVGDRELQRLHGDLLFCVYLGEEIRHLTHAVLGCDA